MLRTLELQSDHLEAHRALAHLRAVDGDYEKAIFSFVELLKLDPEDSEAYFELGELHEIRDEMEKARACWQKAVEVEPDGDYASLAQDKLDATTPEDTAA
jgi:tetratricopeptide (TPR) repeat protein